MVVTRAVIVPDERSWALWGVDLVELGVARAASPEDADVLVAPMHLPAALRDGVREAWSAMPPARRPLVPGDPLPHEPALEEALEQPEHAGHGDRAAHTQHGTHPDHAEHETHPDHGAPEPGDGDGDGEGHDDMMAIVGDPSEDGLVMEDLELALGPLDPHLPGGLVAELRLDGDVVAACALRRTLLHRGLRPDPTTPYAWRAALALASGGTLARSWERVATVELERALSHAEWLAALGRLLGWAELATAGTEASRTILGARRGGDLEAAQGMAERLMRLLDGRRLGWRARGRAVLVREEVEALGLCGPVARAAGLGVDARLADPLYGALGFLPALRPDGDAEARTLVRAEELVGALALARAAREAEADEQPPGDLPDAVEGPRGPLRVRPAPIGRAAALEAPGSAALLEVAARQAVGLELSAALLALASFDLSPWQVTG